MLLTISSNEIGVNTGITSTATESSNHIPLAVTFPSPPPRPSDDKIVRQLFASINKSAAPYISSLVTLSARTDGVTNALHWLGCFNKLVCASTWFFLPTWPLAQVSKNPKATNPQQRNCSGPWLSCPSFISLLRPILIPSLLSPCLNMTRAI